MNIIDHSFPQFLDDVVFKIYTLDNVNFNKLSTNTIYCKNINDNKYYYIKFIQLINNNYNINEIIKYTDNVTNINVNNQYSYLNNHNNHNEYTILEDIHDVPLQYCNECDSIIKQSTSDNKYKLICNDCLKSKCKCLFC